MYELTKETNSISYSTSSAKVFAETERFWSLTNRSRVPLADEFDLQLDLQTSRNAVENVPAPEATTAAAPAAPTPASSAASPGAAGDADATASSHAEETSSLEPKTYKFHLQRVTSRSQPLVQRASTTENDPNGVPIEC